MNRTRIEYLDYTWNPISMRCTPVSDGCLNCWHLAMAKRLTKNPLIDRNRQTAYAGGPFLLDEKELDAPMNLKNPSRIGVQFMGDIFHEHVNPEWMDAIWEVMAACPRHTFMVLTKRPQNIDRLLYGVTEECGCRELGGGDYLSNVWLGVSVEDQKTADERIPILLQIPEAKRFVSVEPMLGPVDLETYLNFGRLVEKWDSLNWVIIGGLSLPGGKIQPPKHEWLNYLIHQSDAARIPIFIKPNAGYPIERREFPS